MGRGDAGSGRAGYHLWDHAHIWRACAALYQDCLDQSCMGMESGLAHNCSIDRDLALLDSAGFCVNQHDLIQGQLDGST